MGSGPDSDECQTCGYDDHYALTPTRGDSKHAESPGQHLAALHLPRRPDEVVQGQFTAGRRHNAIRYGRHSRH